MLFAMGSAMCPASCLYLVCCHVVHGMCHVVAMSFAMASLCIYCICAMCLPYPCRAGCYVIAMYLPLSLPCSYHVFVMPCLCHAFATPWPCLCHVFVMCSPCPYHACRYHDFAMPCCHVFAKRFPYVAMCCGLWLTCTMCLPCLCHVTAESVPCRGHVLPCVCPVGNMYLPCVCQLRAMCLPCMCHVFAM